MPPSGFDMGRYAQEIMPFDRKAGMDAFKQAHDMAPKPKQVKEQRPMMHNGKRVMVTLYTDGTHEISPYEPDAEKLHFTSTGGQVGIGQDPFTGAVKAPGLPATMTPHQTEGLKIDRANLGLRAQQNAIAMDANNAMREVGGGQAQIKIGELSANIRKEVNALPQVKNYNAVVPIIKSAETAPDTKAGDLQLIYSVGKILDPDSVVREGEMVLVNKAGSPAQRIVGYMRHLQGYGQLSPVQRQQLRVMLKDRVRELKNSRDAAIHPYMRQAEAMKLPKDQIFEPPSIDELVEQYTN
jgi:hypothetical protein